MDWPRHRVEDLPPDEFEPPFCPKQACPSNAEDGLPASIRPNGSYTRQCDGRAIPRFMCRLCGASFSQQTFSCTYYLKRPELLEPIAAGLNAGSAHRQLARSLKCAPSTVTSQAARLGRFAILFHTCVFDNIVKIEEPVIYDDFETFAYSQDHPFGIGTSVGQGSWFVYHLENAPHRRGGKVAQKHRKPGPEHCRPLPYKLAFSRMLDRLIPKADGRLDVIIDGHPGYQAALRDHPERAGIKPMVHPTPERGPKGSKRTPYAVSRDHAMSPVDNLHKFIRHSVAHHRRETIAFGRRLNALMERMYLMTAWRNFIKSRTERRPDKTTSAMAIGLTDEPWSWSRMLSQRIFYWRCEVPEAMAKIYRRDLTTTAVGRNQRHRLVNAF